MTFITTTGNTAQLLFTVTDSVTYEIKSKDFYKDMNPDIEKRFDTSDYPTNHTSGIKTRLSSKVLGMFEDEAGGKQLVDYVGLRAKLYSYKMLDGSEDKKCKGVTRNVTKSSILLDDNRECLFSMKEQYRKMNIIQINFMRFIPKKLIKLPSLLTMTNDLLWPTEYTL